jgi:serine/threonine protein kinase
LVTGLLPFKLAVPNDNLYQYFVNGDYIEFWRKRMVNVSPSFMELFDNMVAFDFSQRPSLSEIRESAWMKEINWDLMPLLKQELILREKKIKIYEETQHKKKILLNRENIEQTPQNLNSLLQTKKPIRYYNPIINGNDIKKNDLKNSIININGNQINNGQKEQKKGIIRMKNKIKKINLLMKKIKQYLKNEGYVSYIPNCHKLNKMEFEVSDGEVDILIKIEKQKANYIKLGYFKIKGFSQHFESFKKVINSLKASKVLLKN